MLDAESLLLLSDEPVEVVPGFLQVGERRALPAPAKKVLEAGANEEALIARKPGAGGLDGVYSLDGAAVVVVSVVNNHSAPLLISVFLPLRSIVR